MSPCLSDELVQACAEGRRETEIEAHLAACTPCRRKVAGLALAMRGWEEEPAGREAHLRRFVARRLAARKAFPWWIPATAAAVLFVAILLVVSNPATPADPLVVLEKKPVPVVAPKKVDPEPPPPPKPEPKPQPIREPEVTPPPPKPEPPPPPKPEPPPQSKPEPRFDPEPPPPKPEPKPAPPEEAIAKADRPVLIEAATGAVRLMRRGEKKWEPSGARTELGDGDRLQVQGDARLRLADGGALAVHGTSDLTFDRAAHLPHRLTVTSGEIFVEGSPRLAIKTGVVELSTRAAAFHLKADRDDAILTVYSGEADCRNEQGQVDLKEGTQLAAAKAKAPVVRKVGSTVALPWLLALQAIHFMDDFEGVAFKDAWDDRQVDRKLWDLRIEKGQLACRSSAERGEQWKSWTLWTRHGVKVEKPVVFEVTMAVDRVGSITPNLRLAQFQGGERTWRLDFGTAEGRDVLSSASGDRERELKSWPSGLAPGRARRIEIALDPKDVAVAVDGQVRHRGPHDFKDLGNVLFGVGQSGRLNGKPFEARFDRVKIAPLSR